MPTATRFARPSSSSAAYAADSWPLPPSISDQIGKRSALLEQLAVAAEHDFVHRGEVVEESRLRLRAAALVSPSVRIAAPPSRAIAELPILAPAACGRPRRPPSTPPSRCPESSRCRSTRCAAAAPAARAPRCSVSSASYCAVVRLVEARLIGERGVAVGEIDEAALLAALRHDDAHAAAGALRQPALERLALVGLAPARESPAAPVAARRTAGSPLRAPRRRVDPDDRRLRCRARCARRRGRCAPGTPG